MIEFYSRGRLPGDFWVGFRYPLPAKLAERVEGVQAVTTRRPTPASDDHAGRYGGPRAHN